MTVTRETLRELDALYARVPDVGCKGRCFETCCFISTGEAERARMRAKEIEPPKGLEAPCRHLDFAGRCSIYEDRPMVCRLYGAMPQLRCQWGCRPVMSDDEAGDLMRAAIDLPMAR